MSGTTHVHDVGSTGVCSCGWVLRIPPVYCSIEVSVGRVTVVNEGFNCETVHVAISALNGAILRLERYAAQTEANA